MCSQRVTRRLYSVHADALGWEQCGVQRPETSPASFTRPWSARILMIKSSGPIFENGCQEGDYGLRFIEHRRWEERNAAKAAGK